MILNYELSTRNRTERERKGGKVKVEEEVGITILGRGEVWGYGKG